MMTAMEADTAIMRLHILTEAFPTKNINYCSCASILREMNSNYYCSPLKCIIYKNCYNYGGEMFS